MVFNRLIPSLLLQAGRLRKGVRYRNHRDAGNPVTTARAHNAQGADELILLDIEASRSNRPPDFQTVSEVAKECSMPLTVGGGVSNREIAKQCMDNGADKLLVTTGAYDDPGLIGSLADIYGNQAIVLGADVVDTRDGWRLFDHRRNAPLQTPDPLDWIRENVQRGAGEIRLMAVSREGTRTGMHTELFRWVASAVNVPIVLEGGAGSLADLDEAMKHGCTAVAVGSLLVFSDNNLFKVKRYLANAGHRMRV